MRWHLKASKKHKGGMSFREWVEQLEADGHDTTGMLDDEPDLFKDLIQYWQAFHVLSSSRSSGMSIGAIPLSAYESYFRIFGIDSLEERLNYIKFVGILDNEFLEYQREKDEAEKKKKQQSDPKSKTGRHQATPPKR